MSHYGETCRRLSMKRRNGQRSRTMKSMRVIFITGFVIAALSGFSFGQKGSVLPQYPHAVITNGIVETSIFLPDAQKGFYRGSRYEWSGMPWQLTYQGHSYFIGDKDELVHEPDNPDHGISLAEEFDSTGRKRYPQRFDAAKPGETFMKIGVGNLEKPADGKRYSFAARYKIADPGKWKTRKGKNWIEFTHTLSDAYGFGYVYVKRIELLKNQPRMVISHVLRNTGDHTIIADQYCHNFFHIDGEMAGKNYRIDLFFPAVFERDLGPVAAIRDNSIIFERDVEKALFTYIAGYGGDISHNHAVIRNLRTGAGVDIRGDFPIRGFNFYSAVNAVCPELYVDINVEPGKTQKWTRSYVFFVEKTK